MKIALRLAAALLLCAGALPAHAQYPEKPLRLIVPFPPGGNIDATARIVASGLSQSLGQPVIVENKAGAAGIVGAEFVARSAPDGYTAVLGSTGALAALKALHPNARLEPTQDFAAAGTVARAPLVLAVSAALPVKTVAEFISYAKERPGKLTMASAGVGTAAHLTGELFQKLSGTKLLHVPYKGSSLAVADLLGGHVDMTFDQLASTLAQIKAGKLHALGVTTETRSSVMPELPTLAESGLPGFEASTTTGVLFPAGTPKAVLDRVSAAMKESLAKPEVRQQLRDLGADALPGSGADFDRILASETVKWNKVAQEANIQPAD
ncbi:putattive exported protein [Bordetella ansorpii]|uniref:Putattive exported protein n=1 Tax=Bordetella ansorpii TaxID=288768 RepID=A0A157SDI9_9BORD|nr:tripartite tricarboxylate transporter substrate binding protein [Bordetella ansorpii]SAI68487.1 putattive exported protein [Bordetella ansorpii]